MQVEEYVRTTGAQKGDKWRLFKHKSGQVEKSFKAAEKAGFKQCVAEDVDWDWRERQNMVSRSEGQLCVAIELGTLDSACIL